MLWLGRVRVRVMERLERALAFAYQKFERLAGLGVGDRDRDVAVVLTPQQPDLDPVATAAVELACDVVRGWVISLPSESFDRYALTTNGRAARGQPRGLRRLLAT